MPTDEPGEWGLWRSFSLSLLSLAVLTVLLPERFGLGGLRRKAVLCAYGAVYLALSRDGDFPLPPDPGKSRGVTSRTKRVIFVRHGESEWNACFNRAHDAWLPLRILAAVLREVALLFCLDSLFLDSPLSEDGLAQARSLEQILEGEGGEELRRYCDGAVFASSCLRRAAATALVAFGRALRGGRPVWVLSCLQEISRNVDTLALASPYCAPPLVAAACGGAQTACGSRGAVSPPGGGCLQGAFNWGNKGFASHGGHRLERFCEWAFSECGPAALQPTIVAVGHSLWFQTFFQIYLPHAAYHECKQAKIVNCGAVMFDLEELRSSDGDAAEYRIAPESVVSLYGGFEKKKARRWTSKHKQA